MPPASSSILDHIGRSPRVPLGRLAAGLPAPVLAKCEYLNPGGSVKDRIALAIVHDAEQSGLLAPGATLIEATAGNTGVGLLRPRQGVLRDGGQNGLLRPRAELLRQGYGVLCRSAIVLPNRDFLL